MAEPLLSLSWKDHSNNLATLCKSSLHDNFLVDCTLAAEGHSLKAHRLILSACSPYFRTLFSEEREKHPIVILKDTLFDTLKAVVHFVYHGETQIAGGHLEAFLALAGSLQIKGLNNSPTNTSIKDLSPKPNENVPQNLLECNLDPCEIQSPSGGPEDRPRNSHLSLRPGDCMDVQQSIPPISLDYSDPCEKERLSSLMAATLDQQIPFGCSEHCSDPEIIVKQEPLYPVFLEPRDPLGGVGSDEPMTDHFSSEINKETIFVFGEQEMNQSSGFEKTCHGRMDSAPEMVPQQQATLDEASAANAEETDPLLPVILVPKSEQMDDAGKEYLIRDILQNDMNGRGQETKPREGGEIINQCSSAGTEREFGRGRAAGQRAQGRVRLHSVARPFRCTLCPAAFNSSSGLHYHKRKHTGERPHSCDVCGAAFHTTSSLIRHKRTHTGERPYSCEVCGSAFNTSSSLNLHKRTHTGERPYSCEVCGAAFNRSTHLSEHIRTHTGERPYKCDFCGAAFITSTHLTTHKRTHTGERPYKCDVCGDAFRERSALKKHMRTHTGERPYPCVVCGAAFTTSTNLIAHKRTHTGERPYSCDVCGVAFIESSHLTAHKRIHTGERPYPCDLCGAAFVTSSNLAAHRRTHFSGASVHSLGMSAPHPTHN